MSVHRGYHLSCHGPVPGDNHMSCYGPMVLSPVMVLFWGVGFPLSCHDPVLFWSGQGTPPADRTGGIPQDTGHPPDRKQGYPQAGQEIFTTLRAVRLLRSHRKIFLSRFICRKRCNLHQI